MKKHFENMGFASEKQQDLGTHKKLKANKNWANFNLGQCLKIINHSMLFQSKIQDCHQVFSHL